MVISGRYIRALHLRAEAVAQSESDAKAIADQVGTFVSLFHSAESSIGAPGSDVDVKAFLSSLKVEQSGERAILTATVPPGFIRKALTESPADQQIAPPAGKAQERQPSTKHPAPSRLP